MEHFGCSRCWPDCAEDAWVAKQASEVEVYLIDEPHYIVSIWFCPDCDQHFLNVTTETVDWMGGEDPVYRTFIPVTRDELAVLTASGPPSEPTINAIGPGRRSLRFDWPGDSAAREYWSTGIRVGRHD